MAAEVDQPYSGWSHGELTGQDQSQEVPQMHDHGSISFGRYAVESLSWEKRSTFEFNRCQEELQKLKCPGLVAQKKAYFEDYYRRIRALKGLTVDPQTEPLDYGGDGSISCQSSEDDMAAQVGSFEDGTEEGTDVHLEEAPSKLILEEGKNCSGSIIVGHLDPLLSSTESLENFEHEKNTHCTQMQLLDTSCKSHSYTNSKDQRNLLSLDKKGPSMECDISSHNNGSNFAAPKSALSATRSKPKSFECTKGDNPEIRRAASFNNREAPRLKDAYDSRSDSTCKPWKKSSQVQKQFPKAHKEDNSTCPSKAIANRVASNSRLSSVTLHKPPREARCNFTIPHPFSFSTERRAALASSNNNGAVRLNSEASNRLASSLTHGKNARVAQDLTRKTATSSGLANKGLKDRRDHGGVRNLLLSTAKSTCPSDRNANVSGPLKARSWNLPSRNEADLHGGTIMIPTMTAERKKPDEGKVESRLTSAVRTVTSRTIALRQTVNSRAGSPKVVSSRTTNTLFDGRKPRYTNLQEKPRWR